MGRKLISTITRKSILRLTSNLQGMSTLDEPIAIEMVAGKINSNDHGSGKAMVFHSPHSDSVRKGKKEFYLGQCIKECPELGSKGSLTPLPARANVRMDMGGTIYSSSYIVKEGEVLKIFAQGNTFGGNSATWMNRQRTGAKFIRLRSGAPLRRLHVNVPSGIPDSSFTTWHVTGRFDILTLEAAKLLGVAVLRGAEAHFSAATTAPMFEDEIMSAEREPLPVFKKEKVDGVVVETKARRRILEL